MDAELVAGGVRMADFLGGQSRTGAVVADSVAAGVAIGLSGSLGDLLDEVALRLEEGYRRVKLKVRPGWDVEPVGAVRERWPALVLFADANGSYGRLPMGEAAEQLARLDSYGLSCLEQPLGDDDLAGHAELARRLAYPAVPGRGPHLSCRRCQRPAGRCLLGGQYQGRAPGGLPGGGTGARHLRRAAGAGVVRGDGRDGDRPGGEPGPGVAARFLPPGRPVRHGPVLRDRPRRPHAAAAGRDHSGPLGRRSAACPSTMRRSAGSRPRGRGGPADQHGAGMAGPTTCCRTVARR